jgi:hypothetical protein
MEATVSRKAAAETVRASNLRRRERMSHEAVKKSAKWDAKRRAMAGRRLALSRHMNVWGIYARMVNICYDPTFSTRS